MTTNAPSAERVISWFKLELFPKTMGVAPSLGSATVTVGELWLAVDGKYSSSEPELPVARVLSHCRTTTRPGVNCARAVDAAKPRVSRNTTDVSFMVT